MDTTTQQKEKPTVQEGEAVDAKRFTNPLSADASIIMNTYLPRMEIIRIMTDFPLTSEEHQDNMRIVEAHLKFLKEHFIHRGS